MNMQIPVIPKPRYLLLQRLAGVCIFDTQRSWPMVGAAGWAMAHPDFWLGGPQFIWPHQYFVQECDISSVNIITRNDEKCIISVKQVSTFYSLRCSGFWFSDNDTLPTVMSIQCLLNVD